MQHDNGGYDAYPDAPLSVYDQTAQDVVELGNQIAETDSEADLAEIADGLLAGAIQYWLYSRQPCGDPMCDECEPVLNPELRLQELRQLVENFAQESDYFHSPNDCSVGLAQ